MVLDRPLSTGRVRFLHSSGAGARRARRGQPEAGELWKDLGADKRKFFIEERSLLPFQNFSAWALLTAGSMPNSPYEIVEGAGRVW